jgi:hypothetical protein
MVTVIINNNCKLFFVLNESNSDRKGKRKLIGVDLISNENILDYDLDTKVEIYDLTYDEVHDKIFLSCELRGPPREGDIESLDDVIYEYDLNKRKLHLYTIVKDFVEDKEGHFGSIIYHLPTDTVYVNSCYHQGGDKSVIILDLKDSMSNPRFIDIPNSPIALISSIIKDQVYVLGEIEDPEQNYLGIYVIKGATRITERKIKLDLSHSSSEVSFYDRNIMTLSFNDEFLFVNLGTSIHKIDTSTYQAEIILKLPQIKEIAYDQKKDTLYLVQKDSSANAFYLIQHTTSKRKRYRLPSYIEDVNNIDLCAKQGIVALNLQINSRTSNKRNVIMLLNVNIFEKNESESMIELSLESA